MATRGMAPACVDTPGWVNPFGHACARIVADGHCHPRKKYGYPERHCCACANGRLRHAPPPDTTVAFCFVGQFIRHATLVRDVRRFGAARYHAFVASSLQHSEERAGDVVDSATLCEQLRAVGFSGCDALLEPYNASAYYRLTKHLGLRAFFARDVFLYPHRIASFFSTVSRAARAAESHSVRFDMVVFTRLDTLDTVSPLPQPTSSWWAAAAMHDAVAIRHSGAVEDRFFLGRLATMRAFSRLFGRFLALYDAEHAFCSPETILFRFLSEEAAAASWSQRGSAPNVSRVAAFVNMSGVSSTIYRRKYDKGFLESMTRAVNDRDVFSTKCRVRPTTPRCRYGSLCNGVVPGRPNLTWGLGVV